MTLAFPQCVPVLTDGVVTLRAHGRADIPRIVEQCQDPGTIAWTSIPHPYAESDATDFLTHIELAWADPQGSRAWAVTDASGVFLGTLDLRFGTDGRADVGFGLHLEGRRRGLMSRAVRVACGWAFEQRTEVVHWASFAGNWGSRRVAWACGFTMHGVVPGLLGSSGRGLHDGWVGTLHRADPMTPQSVWYDAPVLVGTRLRLRPWHREDVVHLVDPDEDAQRFMPYGAAPFVAHYADWRLTRETRMADGEGVYWCIADLDTDRPVGHVQLFRLDQASFAGCAEVGYWLLPIARGQARMSEALALVRDFAFGSPDVGGLGLHRLDAGTDADNVASNAVLRRAGFTQIGVEHEIMTRADGTRSDGLLWELLVDDGVPGDEQAPTIDGTALRLRAWRSSDADRIAQACRDPETRHWLTGLPDPYDRDAALAYVEQSRARTASGAALYWAVADLGTDAVVGALTFMPAGAADTREVGYWTHPDARGRATMTEAVRLAVRHARIDREDGGLGLRRLVLRAAVANIASQRVAERAGFVRTGIARAVQPLGDGTLADEVTYDLLCTDSSPGPVHEGGPEIGRDARREAAVEASRDAR